MRFFTLNDIAGLMQAIGCSSKNNDLLPLFMLKFNFIDKYETADDSIVFVCGGEHAIEIEFFDMDDVYKRTVCIMYRENAKSRLTILEWEDLQKLY